mgnify:CR=1 FL=1
MPELQVAPYYVHFWFVDEILFYFIAAQRVGWNIFSLEKFILIFNLIMLL